jgi:hypothetical protein
MGHTILLGFKNLSDSTLPAHAVLTLQVRIADSRDTLPADILYLLLNKRKDFIYFL